MRLKTLTTMLLTLVVAVPAFATNVYSEQFQTIKTVELYEIVHGVGGKDYEVLIKSNKVPTFIENLVSSKPSQKVNIGNILMITKQLIALGKEIYKIVEAGRPVTTITSVPIEVLPRDEHGNMVPAMLLSNWKAPVVRTYRVAIKNYLGITPVSFEFMLIFSYGGQNKGKGQYITGAEIRPTNVTVKWGYKLDAQFKVQSILNEGSVDSPIAGAVLMLDYKVSTIFQDQLQNKTFYINGKGQVTSY